MAAAERLAAALIVESPFTTVTESAVVVADADIADAPSAMR
jgi:hypothetical protein